MMEIKIQAQGSSAKTVLDCTPKQADFDEILIGKKAKLNILPMQPGDVPETYASTESLKYDFNYEASTDIKQGIKQFIKWYKEYYGS